MQPISNNQMLQSQNMLIIEKQGIVYENGEYALKTIREEIDLSLFNNVIQILGYQGFDQSAIQKYITDFGEFLVNEQCVYLESEIAEMVDYKNLEKRKHFF
jgi:hypothetical protein